MITESTDLRQLLHKHFPQIAEPALQEQIVEVGKLMHFEAWETIMDFGSYVKLVPLIISGSIKVTREDEAEGRELLLYFLGPGETCSMSFTCCMMQKKSPIRTQAVEDTTLIGIPIRYVDQWMMQYQSWKNFVMQTYDDKMIEMVKAMDSLAFESLDLRLQKYLEARAEATGSQTITATHQEIAYDLNASREAISRLLKKLETSGEIALGRNEITLLKQN
jgi:CRP/FNR family transcriptional regulator